MKYDIETDESTPGLSLDADALRGRQSVRVTFRLPSPIIELLSIAANQLGIKQKSLFDQLVEDREGLEQVAAGAATRYRPAADQRQQKTYVVSRNTLVSLEYVAKTHGIPRDLLVEISINRLLPVISSEQEKQAKRKVALAEMEEFLRLGDAVLARAGEMLGSDDPAFRQLALALGQGGRAVVELRVRVEKGRAMERYQ